MKIAQVICTFPPYKGGMGNSALYISRALCKFDHNITVITPKYHRDDLITEKEKFKLKRLRAVLTIGNGAILPQILWKLKKFDIVHFHYPFCGSSALMLLVKIIYGKRLKLILHYHMDIKSGGVKGLIFKFYNLVILPMLARQADMIFCSSIDYIKNSYLAKYYLENRDKFKQIAFGVNLEQFVTYKDHKNKERKNNVILFVAGLDKAHYFKGLENLISALNILKKSPKHKNTILKIIGDGNMKSYYKEYAKKLGLRESVKFYDNVDNSQLVNFYNYSDVFVLPSINMSEAFGLVLLEAMACSKPVIASNLPGVRSVFKNGKQGLLVKPGDVNDLAHKLKIILEDKDKAVQMGLAGRQLVEKKYNWDKVGEKLNLIYYNVKYAPK